MRVNQNDGDLIEKNLLSYLPGLSVAKIKDYLPKPRPDFSQNYWIQTGQHFAFPLKKQETLDKHDPIAYMTGNMTKLSEDELISFQLIIAPLNKRLVPDIKRISKLIYSCGDLVVDINNKKSKYSFFDCFSFILFILGTTDFTSSLWEYWFSSLVMARRTVFSLEFDLSLLKKLDNPYQQELEKLVKAKTWSAVV